MENHQGFIQSWFLGIIVLIFWGVILIPPLLVWLIGGGSGSGGGDGGGETWEIKKQGKDLSGKDIYTAKKR